jgi:hypothetical protein
LPPKDGTLAFAVRGCASAESASGNLEAQANSRSLPGTTSGEVDRIEVVPVIGGVRLVHAVHHACCLKGTLESALSGDQLTIVERLSGNPCRCRCASDMEGMVRLRTGRHRVRVVTVTPSGEKEAWSGTVDVP